MILQSSAKSFTAGSQRNHIATAAKTKRDRDKEDDETEGPADLLYKSIDEFNSVVELYRGRWVMKFHKADCSLGLFKPGKDCACWRNSRGMLMPGILPH